MARERGNCAANGENVLHRELNDIPAISSMLVRRSAELAGIAGIDGGRVAVLETVDFAATGDGDTIAYFPFDGWRRRG